MNPSTGVLLLGLFFLAVAGYFAARRILVQIRYRQTTCKILKKRIVEESEADKPVTYRPEFDIEYTADGSKRTFTGYAWWKAAWHSRNGALDVLNRFDEGKSYPCWYDPGNPAKATLVLGNVRQTVTVVVLAAVGIGLFVVSANLSDPSASPAGDPAPEEEGTEPGGE